MSFVLLAAIVLPLAGAAVCGGDAVRARRVAAAVASAVLALTAVLVLGYPPGRDGPAGGRFAPWDVGWLGGFGAPLDVRLSLGLDGLSLGPFALASLLGFVALLARGERVRERAALFYRLVLVAQAGMLGVFAAGDVVLFYACFEAALIPLFLLIGAYGGEHRRGVATRFFLQALLGAMLTFLGLAALVVWGYRADPAAGMTFSIVELTARLDAVPVPAAAQRAVSLALLGGFAVKVSLFPLHTWLPVVQGQAPTAAAVLLTGVLLKVGAYGFLRFHLPLLPDATVAVMPWLLGLSAATVLCGALAAAAQSEMKRLVAYVSVAHLGLCVLGTFALNRAGLEGAAVQMVAHGIAAGGLLAIAGMVERRYGTCGTVELGGLARRMPRTAIFMAVMLFAAAGVPGLSGFVGQILVLLGTFQRGWAEVPVSGAVPYRAFALAAVAGVVLAAGCLLVCFNRLCFGPLREPRRHTGALAPADLCLREVAALAPLAAAALWIGLVPQSFLDRVRPAIAPVVERAEAALASESRLPPALGGEFLPGTPCPPPISPAEETEIRPCGGPTDATPPRAAETQPMPATDRLAAFGLWLAPALGGLLLLAAARPLRSGSAALHLGLVLAATGGLALAAAAADLIAVFLGMELVALSVVAILYLARRGGSAREAAVKYFFLHALAAVFLLYGMAMLYGAAGRLDLASIAASFQAPGEPGPLGTAALVLLFAGLGYAVAAVPFQLGAAEVQAGTTPSSAAVLSVLPRAAGFLVLVRLVGLGMPGLASEASLIAAVLAVATMTYGNLLALVQQDLRRLLAYASIAQSGFVLMALAAGLAGTEGEGGACGLAAALVCLAVYCLAIVGAYAVMKHLGCAAREPAAVDELAGLSHSHPAAAAMFALFLFSLAGAPPLAGFWGKLTAFMAVLNVDAQRAPAGPGSGFAVLALLGAANVVLTAAYCLRIVAVMYFRLPLTAPKAQGGRGAWAAAIVCAAAVVLIGLIPGPLIREAHRAAGGCGRSLRPSLRSEGTRSGQTAARVWFLGHTPCGSKPAPLMGPFAEDGPFVDLSEAELGVESQCRRVVAGRLGLDRAYPFPAELLEDLAEEEGSHPLTAVGRGRFQMEEAYSRLGPHARHRSHRADCAPGEGRCPAAAGHQLEPCEVEVARHAGIPPGTRRGIESDLDRGPATELELFAVDGRAEGRQLEPQDRHAVDLLVAAAAE